MPQAYQLPWEAIIRPTWGVVADGVSLHRNPEDCQQYISEYWQSLNPIPVQHCRPVPEATPQLVEVDEATFERIQSSKCGIRIYDYSGGKAKDVQPS